MTVWEWIVGMGHVLMVLNHSSVCVSLGSLAHPVMEPVNRVGSLCIDMTVISNQCRNIDFGHFSLSFLSVSYLEASAIRFMWYFTSSLKLLCIRTMLLLELRLIIVTT